MRIEAFTEAKTPDDSAGNEDQLLILPGRGHAVIDGVTDRTGHRYDGRLAARLASQTVQQATTEFLLELKDQKSAAVVREETENSRYVYLVMPLSLGG